MNDTVPARMTLRSALAACALLAAAACQREEARPPSFVQSLRCGMTRADVTRLAREGGYDNSDRSWLTRALARKSAASKELSLVDLTFRDGRLVAFREGRYVPRTKRVEYRTIDLCKTAPRRP